MNVCERKIFKKRGVKNIAVWTTIVTDSIDSIHEERTHECTHENMLFHRWNVCISYHRIKNGQSNCKVFIRTTAYARHSVGYPDKIPPEKIHLNAVEHEPVPTRVLNHNASEASYKPKQRSYRKTKLIFLYFFQGDFSRGYFVGGIYPGTIQ